MNHWQKTYSSNPVEKLGWYEPHLQTSLGWIKTLGLSPDAPIIDVGGGASTLVDDLLALGHRSITVLDISDHALSLAKARLGKQADLVTWWCGDITGDELPAHQYELWHDRAVFHFLTNPEQQEKYREKLLKALRPEGQVIMGTFSPEAPPKCSGLPVQRYSARQLSEALGEEFELLRSQKELHTTPGGVEQMYLYCHFLRKAK